MRIRLGYVAIALSLPKVTSSSNVTYSYYHKLISEEKRLNKLKQITLSNFNDLEKILDFNIRNQIHFYRITSALIPLATHPDVNWDYRNIFSVEFKKIGKTVIENNMRIDTHPDQFNVINSENHEVVENTKRNLMFHANFFKDMEYNYGKMVLHIGSSAGGKVEGLKRFVDNFKQYPKEVTSRLIMENDDKTFTARETLGLCQEIKVPMVLDYHHHICNNDGDNIDELLLDIFNTWKGEELPPKIHFSTPRDHPLDRKHADFINAENFVNFMEKCKNIDVDIDCMIEAKMKDLALFDLVKKIKILRPNWNWLDNSTFEI